MTTNSALVKGNRLVSNGDICVATSQVLSMNTVQNFKRLGKFMDEDERWF